MEHKSLNLKEAAEFMGVSEPTMRQIARREDFPAVRVGKRWIIPSREFTDWLGKQASARAELALREGA